MFKVLASSEMVEIEIDDAKVSVQRDISVAAALMLSNHIPFRYSKTDGSARAPYCMMGVCAECLITINDEPNQFACQRRIKPGMRIHLHHIEATQS